MSAMSCFGTKTTLRPTSCYIVIFLLILLFVVDYVIIVNFVHHILVLVVYVLLVNNLCLQVQIISLAHYISD